MNDFTAPDIKDVLSKTKGYLKYGVTALAVCMLLFNSYGYNDSGVSLRLQQPIIGHTWIKEEGYYFKLPFVSRIRPYNQTGTVASSDDASVVETASLSTPPRDLQFADSYEMHIEWSLRYSIPTTDEDLEVMHKYLKSEANMLGNTMMPFAQTLASDTAGQMLAGNFAQGGRNQYRSLMDNQSQFGMYETIVEKVKVKAENANVNVDRGNTTKATDQYIRKVVYLLDKQGKKMRRPLSISQYGLKIIPNSVNLLQVSPKGRLVEFIDNKQQNISLQIGQEENQKLLREKTKTAQLQGQRDMVDQTNTLNIKKATAIINMEREVAEARLQAEKEGVQQQKIADLAIIDKTRELQVAKANEGIQRANAVSAKHQAGAIKLVGFAEAAVQKAKYQAIDPLIMQLEVDKATALAMYKSNMTVNMPTVVSGGSQGSSNSLEMMTTLSVMEKLGRSPRVSQGQ